MGRVEIQRVNAHGNCEPVPEGHVGGTISASPWLETVIVINQGLV